MAGHFDWKLLVLLPVSANYATHGDNDVIQGDDSEAECCYMPRALS